MPLSLTCTCGAKLEIDDKFAGKIITCPDCDKQLSTAPEQVWAARTSGYAIASLIFALVGPFTLIAPLLAIACGAFALSHITRQPEAVGGKRFALAGIILGSLFAILSLAAYLSPEVLRVDGLFRLIEFGKKLEYPSDLEIKIGSDEEVLKFVITRPNRSWGKAQGDDLILVQPWNDACVVCVNERYDQTGEESEIVLQRGLDLFLESDLAKSIWDATNKKDEDRPKFREPKTIESPDASMQIYEMLVDLSKVQPPRTFLVRVVKMDGRKLFVVAGGTRQSRFARMEPELRQIVESYKLQNPNGPGAN
jgi:hypothetical protein